MPIQTLGITGGIGSGKSVVSRVLSRLGISVFDADREAKSLYDNDLELKRFMIGNFGNELYDTPEGKLNPKYLAAIIFGDENALHLVEREVHQRTLLAFLAWREKQQGDWCGIESAILYKADAFLELCDAVLEISAPKDLRISRIIERDGASGEEISARLKAQEGLFEGCTTSKPRFRLSNDSTTPLLAQIMDLISRLKLFPLS